MKFNGKGKRFDYILVRVQKAVQSVRARGLSVKQKNLKKISGGNLRKEVRRTWRKDVLLSEIL